RLWDVATGKEVRQLTGHEATVRQMFSSFWPPPGTILSAVAFARGGKVVASASRFDKAVRLWDVATGKELKRLDGHLRGVECLAISPNGRVLATGGSYQDGTIRLWDVDTGRPLRQLPG